MATQGIVSIMRDGEVAIKIIAGIDGNNANNLVRRLRSFTHFPTPKEVYDLAILCSFGSESDLVVLTKDEVLFRGDGELDKRYRRTFSDPRFNPRWAQGTADYVKVIQLANAQ